MIRCILLFAFSISALLSTAQTVTVSKELSIRSDKYYELLGEVGDRMLLYRDQGKDKLFEIYDQDLKHLYQRDLKLVEPRAMLHCIYSYNDSIVAISGYKKKGEVFLVAQKYNQDAVPTDTVYIYDGVEKIKPEEYSYALSKNKRYTLLFTLEKKDRMSAILIKNEDLSTVWNQEILITDFNVRSEFHSVIVTNTGEVHFLFFNDDSRGEKEDPQVLLVSTDAGLKAQGSVFAVPEKNLIDLKFEYDANNDRIILAGLCSSKRNLEVDSYYFTSMPVRDIGPVNNITYKDIDQAFIKEIYGEKLSKKKTLEDFRTKEIVVRNDGGILLMTEMYRDFFRRSGFGNQITSRGKGYIDIYYEDVVGISLNPDGKEDWKKVFYKKQFSQDDAGIYSSFFLFKSPSRLRMIYNDEIKNNITVSEYLFDPLGNRERNSLLSTEYQNLKLRWNDAIQLSNSQLLVPSEQKLKLNLVKVDYTQ